MEQIRLSWSEDPRSTMTITWQSNKPLAEPGVEFGEERRLGSFVRAVSIGSLRGRRTTYTATLRGLEPATTYFYRVGDLREGKSRTFSFRTAPAGTAPFTFTAFADHGVSSASRRNVERILESHLPAFHLIPGDLSYANGNPAIWERWLRLVEPLSCRVPLMVCPGNHEYEPRSGLRTYRTLFVLPGEERYYRFDYAGARFILIDSSAYRDREQLRWLGAELKRAREEQVGWLIVAMHHPFYSSTANRLNDLARARVLEPLFDRYRPDLVLAGHNHNYERTYPLRRGQATLREQRHYRRGSGVIYVTIGGGGHSLYAFVERVPPFTARREYSFHYLHARVSEEQLTVEIFRTSDKTLIDRFVIER